MNTKLDPVICIYVDVDDTLIRSAGSKRIPIPAVIRHVRDLYEKGALLYCWSSGGRDYARESAAEVGIADCFADFLPKPNVVIDDQQLIDWPQFIHVYPASCRALSEYASALRGSNGQTPIG